MVAETAPLASTGRAGHQCGVEQEDTLRAASSVEAPHLQQKVHELEQQVHLQADRSLRQARDTLLAGCVCFWLISILAWFAAVLKGQLPFATFAETLCSYGVANDGKVFVAPLAIPAVLYWMSHYVYVLPNASVKPASGQRAAHLDPPHLFVRHYVVNALLVFIALLPTFQVFHTFVPPQSSSGHHVEAPQAMLRLPPAASPAARPQAMLAVKPPLPPSPVAAQPPLPNMRPPRALQLPPGLSFAQLATDLDANVTFLPPDPPKPIRSGQFTSLIMASSVVSVHQAQVWLHACLAVSACGLFAISELYLCLCHPLLPEDELIWRNFGLATLFASLMLFMLNKVSSQVSPSLSFFLLSALFTKLANSKVPTRIPWSQCFTMLIALACVVLFQPRACVLGCWTFRYDMLIGAALVWQQQLIWAFSSQLPRCDWFTVPVLEIPACCLPWGHIGFIAVLVDDMQMAHPQGLWEVFSQCALLSCLVHFAFHVIRRERRHMAGSYDGVNGKLADQTQSTSVRYRSTGVDP